MHTAVSVAVVILVSLFGAYYAVFGRAFTQPDPHLAIARTLPRVLFEGEAVRVGDRYLAQSSNQFEAKMNEEGFAYLEQMGAGYFFEKDGDRYISDSHQYSRFFRVFSYPKKTGTSTSAERYECDSDAKRCPDGSVVGRTGLECTFAECPSPDARSGVVVTYLGGPATSLSVTVEPRQVVSDSRCPSGVQCIWAGTVEVRTVISTAVAHGEHVLTLGEPQDFGDFEVVLDEVAPYPSAVGSIPEYAYRFTYRISKK